MKGMVQDIIIHHSRARQAHCHPGCILQTSSDTHTSRRRDVGSCDDVRECKLQAPVYDNFPSTTAVFSYAIGPRKLSANEQIFVGAQTVVSLLQTTQITQGVSFIAANKVYSSTNKTTIVWLETELFFFVFFTRGGCVSCLRACFGVRFLLLSY